MDRTTKTLCAAALLSTASAIISLDEGNIARTEYNHSFTLARIIADTNFDGRTSQEEWQKVYEELGIKDITNQHALTTSELRQYIENHSK